MSKLSRWILFALFGAAVLGAAAAATTPNLERALEEQSRLVAEHPYDAAALNDLGNLLQLAARPDEAEDAYRRAIEAAPDRAPARYNLALLLHRAGRRGEALDEYRAVVEHDPAHAWARYQMGAIYEAQGDQRRAVRWYGEAFALEPRLAFPEYNPGVIENGLVEEAMLTGYRTESGRPLAPQVYEQPGRIRSLMLPGQAAPAEEPAVAGEPAADPAPVAQAPQTLDPGDLDDRTVNQAAPQGAGRSRSRFRPGLETESRTQVRTWQRPEQPQVDESGRVVGGAVGVPVVPGQPNPQEQPPPGSRVIVPGESGRFRPGGLSTGRLELELAPAPQERPS